ncbi:phosphoadenosine phosphosulfate reductase family protein [Candidatus Gottesmanbacteria bacterium]|nr:phosphoadenosine phosphosulfate reductase family protein [Candidatus Gottesmanbacteria bacterium]
MDALAKKIAIAQDLIRQAYKTYGSQLAVAWTGGKDSTVMLDLIRSTFHGKVPFPVMFNDSTMEFEEIYAFIETITTQWKLRLHVVKHVPEDLKKFYQLTSFQKKELFSRQMKIHAIASALDRYHYKGFLVAIRWDEHASRSRETYLSQRTDHVRFHPILHFTEADIWSYIKSRRVPYVALYDHGYRSLGEKPFTHPAKKSQRERSGREPGKEIIMEQLRDLGYW